MKALLLIVLISWGTQCFSQSVGNGSYVVVRGAIEGCESWSSRILDVVKFEGDDPIFLLHIPGVSVFNQTGEQIKSNLVDAIQALTGNKPDSIMVEVLKSEQEYLSIAKEYLVSLRALSNGSCSPETQSNVMKAQVRDPDKMTEPESLEKNIQKIQKQNLARSVI